MNEMEITEFQEEVNVGDLVSLKTGPDSSVGKVLSIDESFVMLESVRGQDIIEDIAKEHYPVVALKDVIFWVNFNCEEDE